MQMESICWIVIHLNVPPNITVAQTIIVYLGDMFVTQHGIVHLGQMRLSAIEQAVLDISNVTSLQYVLCQKQFVIGILTVNLVMMSIFVR